VKYHHIRRLCALEKPGNVTPRATLTDRERAAIFAKTAGTCHVCGGRAGKTWQVDHIVPHRLGGEASVENCLPICRECNTLRRSHSPRVQQLIIRLGTCARNEIRHETDLGEQLLRLLLRRLKNNRARRERYA